MDQWIDTSQAGDTSRCTRFCSRSCWLNMVWLGIAGENIGSYWLYSIGWPNMSDLPSDGHYKCEERDCQPWDFAAPYFETRPHEGLMLTLAGWKPASVLGVSPALMSMMDVWHGWCMVGGGAIAFKWTCNRRVCYVDGTLEICYAP